MRVLSTFTAGSCLRKFGWQYPDLSAPNTTTVHKYIKRFSTICLVSYRKRTRRWHVPNKNKVKGISARLNMSPGKWQCLHHHSEIRQSYCFCVHIRHLWPTDSKKKRFNPLAPNDLYIRRTAQLTSRRCILNIYSTNILTEYFKSAAHSPFFFLFKMPFIS